MADKARQDFLIGIEGAYGRQLRRFLAVRMHNAAPDVQDLMQEVYLRLLRIEDHEAIRNPQAYLFTIASHVLHQHLLRQAATPGALDITDLADVLQAGDNHDPAMLVEVEQLLDRIARSLEEVSPRAYATLMMHRRDGIPLTEVAKRLGVSYTMTKRYLAKALAFCQQQMNQYES